MRQHCFPIRIPLQDRDTWPNRRDLIALSGFEARGVRRLGMSFAHLIGG
jgi:hypothetical protein